MPYSRRPDGMTTAQYYANWEKKDANVGKRNQHIVFIPWNEQEGEEWTRKTNQWNEIKGESTYKIIHYKSGVINHPDLNTASTQADAVIYIRGHGDPGKSSIQSRTSGDVKYDLDITEACQRLIDMGLRSSFPGVIKFYFCHSATCLIDAALKNKQAMIESENAWTEKAFLEKQISAEQRSRYLKKQVFTNKSTARQGADYLRSKGFKHCIFYGYLGPLAAVYDNEENSNFYQHKHTDLRGLESRPWHMHWIWNKDTVRASHARLRV